MMEAIVLRPPRSTKRSADPSAEKHEKCCRPPSQRQCGKRYKNTHAPPCAYATSLRAWPYLGVEVDESQPNRVPEGSNDSPRVILVNPSNHLVPPCSGLAGPRTVHVFLASISGCLRERFSRKIFPSAADQITDKMETGRYIRAPKVLERSNTAQYGANLVIARTTEARRRKEGRSSCQQPDFSPVGYPAGRYKKHPSGTLISKTMVGYVAVPGCVLRAPV